MHQRAIADERIRQQAERLLETSQLPDELAWAHLTLGICHEKELAWEAAVDSYSKGIASGPCDPNLRYFCNNNLGFSLIQLERFRDAEQYCKAAIAVNPDRHNAYKNLGLVRRGLGQLLDAAICFTDASQRAPGDPRAWWFLEQLLASHPEILSQSDELRRTVERLRRSVEHGNSAQMQ